MSFKTKKILYYIIIPIYIFVVVLIIRSIECKFWNLDIALKIATFLKDIALATSPLLTIYINSKIKKEECKHQKEIKKLELFETKKREILENFINKGTVFLNVKTIDNAIEFIKSLNMLEVYFKVADADYLLKVSQKISENIPESKLSEFKNIFYKTISDLCKELEY